MFRSTVIASAVAALVLGPAAVAQADSVSGRLTNSTPGMKVLLIGHDGSAISAPVRASGKFMLAGSKAAMRKAFPKKGPGPTLHLLSNDTYAGPVLLGVKSPTKGYARLRVQGPKNVALGTLTLKKKGYATLRRPLKTKVLDTKRLVRLRKKVPVGAGTQGATGRLARSAASPPSRLAAALPPMQSTLGADADADGVPNLADVDMNGDGILDAAQLEQAQQTADGGSLNGAEVLRNRPFKTANVEKILNTSWRVSVNSNANPGVTWEGLSAYLDDELTISTGVESNGLRQFFCPQTSAESPCAEVGRVTAVEVNCTLLTYCGSDSQAVIMEADPAFDRKPLREVLLPSGAFPLINRSDARERSFTLSFLPKVGNAADNMLVGDAYEFLLKDVKGADLGHQTTVMTSSVATAPEFVSVAGQPYTLPRDDRLPVTLTAGQAAALTVEFFRPQRLNSQEMNGPAPVLIDRGGLEYGFTVRQTSNPGAEAYWCRAGQVASSSADLVELEPGPGPGGIRVARLFDKNLNPVNGGTLSYRVNLTDCLSDPAGGPALPPPPGTTLAIEIESFDSDGNRTRSSVFVKLP